MWFNEDPLPPDVESVLNAAAVLDVTEFHFFELAWADWYGRRGPVDEVEPFFVRYMFNQVVPNWVRQFARKILKLSAEGSLDPDAFGGHTRLEPPSECMRGISVAAIIASGMILMILMMVAVDYLPGFPKGCYFPPCY